VRWIHPISLLIAFVMLGCALQRGGVVDGGIIRYPTCSYVWGEAKDGVRLGLAALLPKTYKPPEFWVLLQNVGDRALLLRLGVIMGRKKEKYTSAIKLIFTNSRGRSWELTSNFGMRGAMTTSIAPLIILLPRGGSHLVEVSFDNYWFSSAGVPPKWALPKGRYRVKAVFEGIIPKFPPQDMEALHRSYPYWEGKVESGEVFLEVIRGIFETRFRLLDRFEGQ